MTILQLGRSHYEGYDCSSVRLTWFARVLLAHSHHHSEGYYKILSGPSRILIITMKVMIVDL